MHKPLVFSLPVWTLSAVKNNILTSWRDVTLSAAAAVISPVASVVVVVAVSQGVVLRVVWRLERTDLALVARPWTRCQPHCRTDTQTQTDSSSSSSTHSLCVCVCVCVLGWRPVIDVLRPAQHHSTAAPQRQVVLASERATVWLATAADQHYVILVHLQHVMPSYELLRNRSSSVAGRRTPPHRFCHVAKF